MDKKNKEMILIVSKINIIMAFLVALIVSFLKISFGIAFLAGTFTALVNFIINSIVIRKCFEGCSGKKARLTVQLSFLIRMFLILGVALLFRGSYVNLVIYLIGFVFHQVAIFIYARRKPKHI